MGVGHSTKLQERDAMRSRQRKLTEYYMYLPPNKMKEIRLHSEN